MLGRHLIHRHFKKAGVMRVDVLLRYRSNRALLSVFVGVNLGNDVLLTCIMTGWRYLYLLCGEDFRLAVSYGCSYLVLALPLLASASWTAYANLLRINVLMF